MKLELSAMLLGLLAANNVMAADVLKTGLYTEQDCSGSPAIETVSGFGNQCLKVSSALSTKVTCSEIETFSNGDCSGSGSKAPVPTGCNGGTKLECVSVADSKIAKFTFGTGCSDGDVTGFTGESYIVLDECTRLSLGAELSFKYTAADGGIQFTVFTEKSDCTGASESATIPIGDCTLTSSAVSGRRLQEGGEIAVKITPAVDGATLGSSAMSASASAFAFVVAVLGAFATMA